MDDWWYGVVGDRSFRIRQVEGSRLEYVNVDVEFVKHYFSLDMDLEKICCCINRDEQIDLALKNYWGLRLIRQDPWECLISYICATYKSIAAIKRMVNNLAERFGRKTELDGVEFSTFPACEVLAAASFGDLQACGLGYRARYVLETSKRIWKESFELESLLGLSYVEAKRKLMEFPGVGAKVADCVLLFSLGKTEAFPVDVWVKRVLLKYYGDKLSEDLVMRLSKSESLSCGDYERLSAFGRDYFGSYAGYAQEYLYHYARMNFLSPL